MNAVGAHQDVAVRAGAVRTGAVKEIGDNAGFILAERAKAMDGMDVLLANPFTHGVMDHTLQPAAMDRKLRQIITGIQPARLAPGLLAEAIGIEQLLIADRDRLAPGPSVCTSSRGAGPLIAWGTVLFPPRRSRFGGDCPRPSHGWPRPWATSGGWGPPIPPPAMITFMDRLPDNRRLRSNVRDQ